MIERPSTHSQEAADATGELYLGNLNLEWDDLRGKKVLDIGAMSAKFENAARRRGVDVVSIDNYPELGGDYIPPKDSSFVIAQARALPFNNEVFDYVLAHMSVMQYETNQFFPIEVESVLREACRVLRTGGEFRFTDTGMSNEELQHDVNDMIPDETNDEYATWRMEREREFISNASKRAGFRDLQLEWRNETRHPHPKDFLNLNYHYVARK